MLSACCYPPSGCRAARNRRAPTVRNTKKEARIQHGPFPTRNDDDDDDDDGASCWSLSASTRRRTSVRVQTLGVHLWESGSTAGVAH